MRKPALTFVLGASLALGSIACVGPSPTRAEEPVQNISPSRHGNLAAAQKLIREAYDKLSEAQRDNNAELGGHAARAKELLDQASDEIKQAAIAANRR